MISQDLKKYKIPDKPGVYRFFKGKSLLYIGKATSLRDRVRSYFVGDIDETRGPKITQMLSLADKLEWQETDSVLEALLLETALIKKHQPKYNSREKDDKSYWYVVITDETFPRILSVRGRELETNSSQNFKTKNIFGPFPYASEIKEALKIIRKIFPFRDKCSLSAKKPCFNRQIGLCPGVCVGEINQKDYGKIIRNIQLLFNGQKKEIIKNLEREMLNLAKGHHFELAGKVRDQIFSLQHIRDVSLLKNKEFDHGELGLRIEAYDIAHLSGQGTVGAMTVWQSGQLEKNEYKKFKLRGAKASKIDDPANLREILERRVNHVEWPKPDIVVVDGNLIQVNVAREVLKNFFPDVEIVGVVKDDKHKAGKLLGSQSIIHDYHRAIIETNAEAHRFAISYHRKLMRTR